MSPNRHPQLVGALGEWLKVRPAPATTKEAEIVSDLILRCALLGVARDDLDAPQLDELTPSETVLINRIRRWAAAEANRRAEVEARIRKESAAQAAAALAEAERAATRTERQVVDHDDLFGPLRESGQADLHGLGFEPEPESIWLGVTAAERAEEQHQIEQTRRRASRQEIFWWSICLIAAVILAVQLLL